MTPPYNYTIRGKKDGFGCQYGSILSGLAFCEHSPDYNYVHTPLRSVSHGWRDKHKVDELNEFIGIPDGREGKEIHKSEEYNKTVSRLDHRPSNWFDNKTLEKIRNYYWSTPKPHPCEQEIVVHIRRGDINTNKRLKRDGRSAHNGAARKRYTGNEWYRDRIPWIAAKYPDCSIAIHSEGDNHVDDPMYEFNSIMDGWPQSLKDRTTWKIAADWIAEQRYDLRVAFHEMVTAKALLTSKSSFAYVAGILSEGDVFFQGSGKFHGYPLDHWYIIQHSSSKHPDGITYEEIINLIKREKTHGTH